MNEEERGPQKPTARPEEEAARHAFEEEEGRAYSAYRRDTERQALEAAAYEEALRSGAFGTPEEEAHLAAAWGDAQAIANGDTASGSWDHINAATERAVRRRREYWRFVIARGLRSLKEGRVKVWNKALDKALRKKLFGP